MVQKLVNKLKIDQLSNTSGKVNSSASKIYRKTLSCSSFEDLSQT